MLMRVLRSLRGRARLLRAVPFANPLLRAEIARERSGFAVESEHEPHLVAAVDWLVRAQDGTPNDGFARGYSLAYNPQFGGQGWQPSYPETTGYIIPTMLAAARRLNRPELAQRALRAAAWEAAIQLPNGAVQGGVIGQGRSPAIFNTGQVMLGWLAAFDETGDARFANAARRAGEYMISVQDEDGHWRKGNSEFARKDTTLYNARAAWGLAEAGARLDSAAMREGAHRNLLAVAGMQHPDGWFPKCCLSDPVRPLLHTLAYTVRGLLEGGRVLGDDALLDSASLAARAIARQVRSDGWLAGRFNQDWSGAASWSCLTGEVQMANNWMRLFTITGDRSWLDPVANVIRFVASTQNRESRDPGLHGGIKGSAPLTGDYGRHELLNWATKYFADALMRHDVVTGRWTGELPASFVLA